jgi:ubiquinone/menaquinone biosynthesis C-methylase UbiE
MKIAKQYDFDYWDGDRKYGYGGYKYIPNRWKPVAMNLIEVYNLNNNSKILDVGCGKGFLLYEIQLLLPKLEIYGCDISKYGLANKHPSLSGNFFLHDASQPLSFKNDFFDLAISMGTFHNLELFDLPTALSELSRVANKSYLMVESYRNDLEFFNLECWALTAKSLLSIEEWKFCFKQFGFMGDYEFIFFE